MRKLYHYTTIDGLIGIVRSESLWASECRFLNDSTELEYARDMYNRCEEEATKFHEVGEDSGYAYPWRDAHEHWSVFTTSFCEDGDLLSQWRGYAKDGGYALGFDARQLQAIDATELLQVVYGIDDPMEFFRNELDAIEHRSAHQGVRSYYATEALLRRVALAKHPHFREEKEWRLMRVVDVNSLESGELHFRGSRVGPIPYVKVEFPKESLTEIIVGPGAEGETRREAVQRMLKFCGFLDCQVTLAETPLRT